MGGPFASYSFDLPKPLTHLLFLLDRLTLALSLLFILLRLRPPPPPSQTPQSHPPSPSSSIKTRLPVVDFSRLAADSPAAAAACVVCLGGFAATDAVRELGNCRHVFHRACIDRWIDADGLTCPLCRSPLLPSPEEEEEEQKGVFVKLFRRARRVPASINLFISNLYVDNYL